MSKLKEAAMILLLGLICPSLWAQTDEERKFMATIDSINILLSSEFEGQDYMSAKIHCQRIIDLYDEHADHLSEGFAYFKYSSYYNMACMNAKMGNRQEAVSNLVKALESGMVEVSYNKVINDTDLKSIIGMEGLKPTLARLKESCDYIAILKESPEYTRTMCPDTLQQIVYAETDTPELVRVREYFGLDSVAVKGDELATIKSILTYIHNRIRHDGKNGNPQGEANSINYDKACKDGSRGLNCRGLATVLNECYMSMGIPSRVITCLPKTYISDCHVINAVYSYTLGKWLWIDPTNNAWVTDNEGNMLSVQEVRERLRTDRPVCVNEEANWNNEKKTRTEDYLYDYMAKNLFYIESWTHYGFNTENNTENRVNYILLEPPGYESSEKNPWNISVNDDVVFWQAPQ